MFPLEIEDDFKKYLLVMWVINIHFRLKFALGNSINTYLRPKILVVW